MRARGFEATTGRGVIDRFERALAQGEDGAVVADVLQLLSEQERGAAPDTPIKELVGVTSLAVPVRNSRVRVPAALRLIGLTGQETGTRRRVLLDRLLVGASRAGDRLVG